MHDEVSVVSGEACRALLRLLIKCSCDACRPRKTKSLRADVPPSPLESAHPAKNRVNPADTGDLGCTTRNCTVDVKSRKTTNPIRTRTVEPKKSKSGSFHPRVLSLSRLSVRVHSVACRARGERRVRRAASARTRESRVSRTRRGRSGRPVRSAAQRPSGAPSVSQCHARFNLI